MCDDFLIEVEKLPPCLVKFHELLCGCDSPGKVYDVLLKYLERLSKDKTGSGYKTAYELFFLYAVDHCGITDHGTSIGYAWLTEDGKQALEFLRANIDKMNEMVIMY